MAWLHRLGSDQRCTYGARCSLGCQGLGRRIVDSGAKGTKILEAGCDQFGGENKPELVVQLIVEGAITESRLDESIRRLLRQKFELGLFDNPFVDEKAVKNIIGSAASRALGEKTQQQSMTLLKMKRIPYPCKPKIQSLHRKHRQCHGGTICYHCKETKAG